MTEIFLYFSFTIGQTIGGSNNYIVYNIVKVPNK